MYLVGLGMVSLDIVKTKLYIIRTSQDNSVWLDQRE